MNILSIITIILIMLVLWQTYNKLYGSNTNSQTIHQQQKTICDAQSTCEKEQQTCKKNIRSIISNNKIKQKSKKHKKVKFALKEEKKKKNEDLVFLDIGSQQKYYGKLIIKLFSNIVPKTCDNFRTLCESKKYFESPFHRIIKDFMIQGGDFTNGNGTGGASIYGGKFPDENFKLKHDRPYLLSMANSGPNTNGSQFFIITDPQPHLDGKHVVFGEIVVGHEVVDELNDVDTDEKDKPLENIKILNCGIYDKDKVYRRKKEKNKI